MLDLPGLTYVFVCDIQTNIDQTADILPGGGIIHFYGFCRKATTNMFHTFVL